MKLPKRTALLILLVLAALLPTSLAAAESNEYQVKTAFLLIFAKLVQWPDTAFASDDAPLIIGILGDEAFTAATSIGIGSKQVGQRPVQLRRLSSAGEAEDCHLVFVSRSNIDTQDDVLSATRGQPSLTVGDNEAFAHSGGAIAFFKEGRKVRFAINFSVAKGKGLGISSRLLHLAKLVN